MIRHGVAAAALVLAAASLPGQSVASRVDAVRNGTVELVFPSRPDVCGDGHGSIWTTSHGNYQSSRPCIHGPVRVSLARENARVISVHSCVACPSHDAAAATTIDAGAAEAARYLLGLARTLSGSSAEHAVSAAAFADATDLSPEFVALVRDAAATTPARKAALFWLGQGDDYPTRDLVALDAGLRESPLREQYVFVLSQRRDDAAVDKLIDIARRDPSVDIRKKAMFWLGQSGDPKAVRFFKDVLTR